MINGHESQGSDSTDRAIESSECSELRNSRRKDVHSYKELAEQFDVKIKHVLRHVRGLCDCVISEEPVTDNEYPWRRRPVIKHLRIEEELPFTRMGELLGCHEDTARDWFDDFDDLEDIRIDSSDRTSSSLVTRTMRIGKQMQEEESDPRELPDPDLLDGSS